MTNRGYVRNCLVCGHGGSTYEAKKEWKEISVCPKCNGAYVDLFYIHKYLKDDWKPNKEIQKQIDDKRAQDAVDAFIYALGSISEDRKEERKFYNSNEWKEVREKYLKPKPLLTIELQDENSVPKVFYKGEEVKSKKNILFDWETSTADDGGGLTYIIEHQETGNKQPTSNRIERRIREHALY
ncbi:hypothetical protein DCC39_14510 [Pueribacillus theae]|uniref:Uncharacterized protein n=1 Tax=Pueribacillus theae TaxID=2171751 RepID=A0A2U1JTX4_9BACI|nr:hypothetical protein [Pueribacillus theae]PWA08647.1 hypothetical protein DCC39_14510 [Pueribacillus theae]